MSALPPPLPRFPSSPPPPVQSFGIGYHKGKVLWTVVGSFILAAVVLGCGGLIHPRWVG